MSYRPRPLQVVLYALLSVLVVGLIIWVRGTRIGTNSTNGFSTAPTSSQQANTWTQAWDFTHTDGNWYPNTVHLPGVPLAGYVDGVGWSSVEFYLYDAQQRGTGIRRSFQPSTITSVTATYESVLGINEARDENRIFKLYESSSGSDSVLSRASIVAPGSTVSWTGRLTDISQLFVAGIIGFDAYGPIEDPGGVLIIKSVTISGEGVNPFAIASWTQTWDFTSTDGDWYGDTTDPGVVMADYVPGEGWTSTTYVTDAMYHGTVIGRSFPESIITSMSVTYSLIFGNVDNSWDPRGNGFISYTSQAPPYRLAQVSGRSGAITLRWDGWMPDIDQLWISALAGVDGYAPYSDPGGRVKITSVTLTGEGTNPFLEDE